MQKIQPPFVQCDMGYSLMGHIPGTQPSLNYGPHPSPVVSPFSAMGMNRTSRDASYEQWQSAAMMYAHSYNQLRHSAFQVLLIIVPFSFAKGCKYYLSKTHIKFFDRFALWMLALFFISLFLIEMRCNSLTSRY